MIASQVVGLSLNNMPKKTTKKATKKVVKKEPKYSLTLKIHDEDLKFKGDSMAECLEQFDAPTFIKSMVYVIGATKEKTTEMIYNGREAQRLFANHGSVALLASNLEKRLG